MLAGFLILIASKQLKKVLKIALISSLPWTLNFNGRYRLQKHKWTATAVIGECNHTEYVHVCMYVLTLKPAYMLYMVWARVRLKMNQCKNKDCLWEQSTWHWGSFQYRIFIKTVNVLKIRVKTFSFNRSAMSLIIKFSHAFLIDWYSWKKIQIFLGIQNILYSILYSI